MFRLGIIEESLIDKSILDDLKQYYISQRLQRVPDDKFPTWHINEYHMDISQIKKVLDLLKRVIKPTWYCHAFNDEKMYVVLQDKWFEVSLERDDTWDSMIEYGVIKAKVERFYLENIPLQI